MYYRNHILFVATLFVSLFLVHPTVSEGASLKERMLARVPEINALKNQGVIGENNRGLLEFRGSSQPQKGLVNGENKDRQAVYAAIAKKQGIDAALVGQRRAKQLAAKGSPGHWFQKPDGSWYKQ
jgi:uncharacterized protein YdbL (DUF1318 family)